jgi:hypothetical protein
MNVTISNMGEQPIRVIVDRDALSETTLDAGATVDLDAPGGIIELKEQEVGGDASGSGTDDDDPYAHP